MNLICKEEIKYRDDRYYNLFEHYSFTFVVISDNYTKIQRYHELYIIIIHGKDVTMDSISGGFM